MKRDHNAIKAELATLTADGLIKPSEVIEFAKNPETALHGCFEWDDTEAAHQYRLQQARQILRVYVEVVPAASAEPVRAFVSLTSDRTKEGGGYRVITDVMSDESLRRQMLNDAFRQFRAMQAKYKHLQQLAKVWDAVDEAEASATDVANAA